MMPGSQSENLVETSTKPARGHTVPARMFRRALLFHIFVCNIVPLLAALALVLTLRDSLLTVSGVVIYVIMWTLTQGLGISVGYHRMVTHRAFQTFAPVRDALVICGGMTDQGPPIQWAALHRRHHECSDDDGDPHSPHACPAAAISRWRGFFHAHTGWILTYDAPSPLDYAPDLLRDRRLRILDKFYYAWVLLGILGPALAGYLCEPTLNGFLTGMFWGGFLRIAVGSHIIWSINSACHLFGSHPHGTGDHSSNVALLALPTFGESWHNNHHAFPTSAQFGLTWWQLDCGWLFIRLLESIGLAWNVKRPPLSRPVANV